MRLDGNRVNLLEVTHYSVLVLLVQRDLPQLLILIPREHLGNHARVSEAQDDQHHLHQYVQQYADDH